MSSNKNPWDIIGWGIIIAFIIRVLPFVLVGGIVFWMIGGFDLLLGLLKLLIGPFVIGVLILIASFFSKGKNA